MLSGLFASSTNGWNCDFEIFVYAEVRIRAKAVACADIRQVWPDGARYEGQWCHDMANGMGRFQHGDGDVPRQQQIMLLRRIGPCWMPDTLAVEEPTSHGRMFIIRKATREATSLNSPETLS